jgi:cytochrome c-type biogenesis protein CcmF
MKEFHSVIGILGHELVILAFVSALVAAISYLKATSKKLTFEQSETWRKTARVSFYVHGLSVFGVVASLFFIIYNHYYEYHYAWSHSSNSLATHYMISCFWEGQEGSFLLWIFWHVIIGAILLKTAKMWENQVMFVFALVQAFLVSMILGVVPIDIESLDWAIKIGSDPFILLRDALPSDPKLLLNPEFVPDDGTGLNPLLQNYWMVIHPPTLFLGFALALVPFAFCMAGLQTRKYTEWVKPALSWSLVGAGILGVGIMMGAYWAYETLNFGGYWNWDPVENAVYIPWLIWVVAIHLMVVFQRSKMALKASMISVVATFILILYATFLTRSGVLGEASVHSFTDLGLSGQLLIYLFAFILLAIALMASRWSEVPTTEKEATAYNAEFWVFIGSTVLALASFQVLIPTSIPVYNALLGLVGVESNVAPPADQIEFYTKWQMWFGLGIAFLSAIGQILWWKKLKKGKILETLAVPLIITFIITTIVILAFGMKEWKLIVLLLSATYGLVGNGSVLAFLAKKQIRLAGGAITHMGISLMLIGILFSAGYSKIISLNNSGLVYNKSFSEDMNNKNWLLFRNEAMRVAEPENADKLVSEQTTGYLQANQILKTGIPGRAIASEDILYEGKLEARQGDTLDISKPYYEVTYWGPRMESDDVPFFVSKEILLPTSDLYKRVAIEPIRDKEGKIFKQTGDTIHVNPENTYFELEYTLSDGSNYTLHPRIQDNEQMGLVPSPDINSFLDKDIYMHVTNMPDPEQEVKWKELDDMSISVGDTFFVNDFVATLDGIAQLDELQQAQLGEGYDVAVQAKIRVFGKHFFYRLNPIMLIRGSEIGTIPSVNKDLGLRLGFTMANPDTGKFTITGATTQKDWIILNALEKPYISLLWIGTILMGIGFAIAAVRRFKDMKKSNSTKEKTPAKSNMKIVRRNEVGQE